VQLSVAHIWILHGNRVTKLNGVVKHHGVTGIVFILTSNLTLILGYGC
jgi:hypothetical protein